MNILVTGAKGMVGTALCNNLKNIRDGKNRTRYREEITKLGREYIQEQHYDNTSDVEELVYSFRKVKAYADIDIPNEEKTMSKSKVLEFLDNLNNSEKRSLLEQVEDYVASFWYYNRDVPGREK